MMPKKDLNQEIIFFQIIQAFFSIKKNDELYIIFLSN